MELSRNRWKLTFKIKDWRNMWKPELELLKWKWNLCERGEMGSFKIYFSYCTVTIKIVGDNPCLFCLLDWLTFPVLLWDHVPERESETGKISSRQKSISCLIQKSISCLIQKVFPAWFKKYFLLDSIIHPGHPHVLSIITATGSVINTIPQSTVLSTKVVHMFIVQGCISMNLWEEI